MIRSCRVRSLVLVGPRAEPVELELQTTGGLMQRIVMTGRPGGSVREARDRIRGCLERAGLPIPRRSVLVNFAPADLPKDGNGLDLPLAIGLLALEGRVDPGALERRVLVGELALDGRLRPIRGALALALEAARRGTERLMLPAPNGGEAALVSSLHVEAVGSLRAALDVLEGATPPPPAPIEEHLPVPADLAEVRGQPTARRALEIAAAGDHNLLLIGPPGTGKTMLAQRLPGLLPPLDDAARLEVSALHGLAGGAATLVRHPPLRAPHHTVSRAGLIGGGTPLAPGEISLAHRGVLLLDEMPEFPRSLLEALRQPLEDRCVRVSRAGRTAVFPADVRVVGTMNPCPCGYRHHPRRACACHTRAVLTYRRRLSGPILDRFDMMVEVSVPRAADLLGDRAPEGTAEVARRVAAARAQRGRVPRRPGEVVRQRLGALATRHGLAARTLERLLDVATTLAALDGATSLAESHVDEAFSLRRGLLQLHDPAAL